ncbi:MAG: hypothetical protein V4655_13240, partial [Bdellovibrionota bacterium]
VSPWEKFLNGDDNSMSIDAKLGMDLFMGKARCNVCHMGWTFSDNSSYDLGLKTNDKGQGRLTKGEGWDDFKFKNPPLLDIVHRAPYMHDGSLADLQAVIEFYNRGGDVDRKYKSADVRPLNLSPLEKHQILSFLRAISAPLPSVEPPVLPE